MTSGTKTEGVYNSTFYRYRTWSGTNGKVETVAGRKRTKWNNYTTTRIASSANPSGSGNYIPFSAPVYGSFSGLFTSNDDIILQSKLVSAVRGHDFNLAVNIAQGKQTINMVVDNLSRIGNAFVSLKRGDLSTAARYLGTKPRPSRLSTNDIAGRWLEMQYGWLPMLGDTYEACNAWAELHKQRVSTVRVSRQVRRNGITTGTTTNYTQTTNAVARKRLIYEMTESLSTQRSLGLLDPLSVAWEIIPYSFVVDWFIPIGSFLDNLSIIPSLSGRFCTTQTYQYWGVNVGTSSPYKGAKRSLLRTEVTRSITSGLSVAKPRFNRLDKALSPKRIWNSIALARQKMRL